MTVLSNPCWMGLKLANVSQGVFGSGVISRLLRRYSYLIAPAVNPPFP